MTPLATFLVGAGVWLGMAVLAIFAIRLAVIADGAKWTSRNAWQCTVFSVILPPIVLLVALLVFFEAQEGEE